MPVGKKLLLDSLSSGRRSLNLDKRGGSKLSDLNTLHGQSEQIYDGFLNLTLKPLALITILPMYMHMPGHY